MKQWQSPIYGLKNKIRIKMELKQEYLEEAYKNEKDLPTKIRLDISTVCQLHCPSCYMRKFPEKVKNGCGIGHLKFKDFKNFIDLNPNIKELELSNSGEIFLNPDFIKIIEYAHSKNIKQTANNGVNLNYLTDEQAEALVKYQFNRIIVSLDGGSQETYGKYRIGGNYETVIENIKKIVRYKRQYRSFLPIISWKYIVFGHNEKDIPNAKKQAGELEVNEISFRAAWNDDFPLQDFDFVKKETGIEPINSFTNTIEQLKDYKACKISWFPCMFLWSSPQINWDGQLLGCCECYDRNFGRNALHQRLIDTLNSPKLIYAKNMIQGKAPANPEIPCYNCKTYQEMKNADIWFSKQ